MNNFERNLDEESADSNLERRVSDVYQKALAEHKEFENIPAEEMKEVIKVGLAEIEELERFADPKRAVNSLTPEIAEKISALWIFSGFGTYDEPVVAAKDRPYKWKHGMDRARLNYAVLLARKIAEMRSPEGMQRGSIDGAPGRKMRAKETIAKYGPALIYNGTELENAAVERALAQPETIVPREKAHILGGNIVRTVDQIKPFSLPTQLYHPGKEVGIIANAPHLVRIVRMLNRYKPLPSDMSVRLFPFATPPEGKEEYATLEIKGLLYYVFLSPDRDAEKEPYPHVIHGKESTG